MRPAAMRRVAPLMYAGAVVAVANGIASGLTRHNVTFYTYSSTSPHTATAHEASSLAAGIIQAIIGGSLWLWMAWKAGTGRNWARVLSTIFFGFASVGLIGTIASPGGPGYSVPAFIALLAEWGVGLVVIIQLWRPESSEFFTWAKGQRGDVG
jgi:hypothetical protein